MWTGFSKPRTQVMSPLSLSKSPSSLGCDSAGNSAGGFREVCGVHHEEASACVELRAEVCGGRALALTHPRQCLWMPCCHGDLRRAWTTNGGSPHGAAGLYLVFGSVVSRFRFTLKSWLFAREAAVCDGNTGQKVLSGARLQFTAERRPCRPRAFLAALGPSPPLPEPRPQLPAFPSWALPF